MGVRLHMLIARKERGCRMKRVANVLVVFLFASMFIVTVSAKERKEGMMEYHKMDMKKAAMMKMMAKREIVATTDGGIVVMIGNKLFKYDKNLKLKNEAIIEIDKKDFKKMSDKPAKGMPECPQKEAAE